MHSVTLLSALAGASLVLAQPYDAPAAPQITTAPDVGRVKPAIERRQSANDECESKARDIWSAQPSVAISDDMARWMMSQAESISTISFYDERYVSANCAQAFRTSIDAPAPIASAYSSFMSASASWASEVKPTVTSLAQSCGGALSAGIELVLATDFESCSTLYDNYIDAANAAAEATSNTGASPTPSTTGAPNGDDQEEANDATGDESTSTSTGGAPRETGFAVAAAAAVVAVAGAMAAL